MADAATIGNVPDATMWKVSHYVTTIHHPDRDVTLIGAPGMAGSYGTRETVRHDTTPRRPVGRPLVSLDSGSVLGPWDMARTNLARECDRRGVLALAASIRARLDAAADGVTVALSVGSHEVIREGRRVRALGDDTSYPIAEYARRAALADTGQRRADDNRFAQRAVARAAVGHKDPLPGGDLRVERRGRRRRGRAAARPQRQQQKRAGQSGRAAHELVYRPRATYHPVSGSRENSADCTERQSREQHREKRHKARRWQQRYGSAGNCRRPGLPGGST